MWTLRSTGMACCDQYGQLEEGLGLQAAPYTKVVRSAGRTGKGHQGLQHTEGQAGS
jgi:hypothetical protein